MLQTSFRRLAVGSVLLCCSTVSAQNWYPNGQQPALGPAQSYQGLTSGFDHAAQSYRGPQQAAPYAGPQQVVQQSPPAGQYEYQLPAPSAYTPAPQQYASAPGQAVYDGQAAAQPVAATPAVENVSPACGDGSCGQGVGGCGPNGCGVAGYPAGGALNYGAVGPIRPSGQTSAGHGFFFRYDRLYSSFSSPGGVRDIGDPFEEGSFIANGIPTEFRNSLDDAFINDDFDFNGNRIEFGFLDGPGGRCGSGWVASILWIDQDYNSPQSGRRDDNGTLIANSGYVLFADPTGMMLGFASALDGNGDEIDADVNGNYVYGRDGVDLGTLDPATNLFVPPFDGIVDAAAPQDNGDLVSFVPVYDRLSARVDTRASGLALSRLRDSRVGGCRGGCFKWLLGVRYINIKERFSLVGLGSDIYEEMRLNARTKNFIIGPEIGMCVGRSTGPWSLSGQLRFTAGANFLRSRQSANFIAADTGQTRDVPLNLFSYGTSNNDEEESFSAIVEWRADAAYALSRYWLLRIGYTGMLIGEVGRASDITYRIPDLGIAGDRSDLYIHALTLGAELAF